MTEWMNKVYIHKIQVIKEVVPIQKFIMGSKFTQAIWKSSRKKKNSNHVQSSIYKV